MQLIYGFYSGDCQGLLSSSLSWHYFDIISHLLGWGLNLHFNKDLFLKDALNTRYLLCFSALILEEINISQYLCLCYNLLLGLIKSEQLNFLQPQKFKSKFGWKWQSGFWQRGWRGKHLNPSIHACQRAGYRKRICYTTLVFILLKLF